MASVHDRYSKTFTAMLDELTVINWRALTALNVAHYVQERPGVFALALGDPHDLNRIKPPYHLAWATDLRAALADAVDPVDQELRLWAQRGERWFKVYYGSEAELDQQLAEVKTKWDAIAAAHSAAHADVVAVSPTTE